jgi:hypothetical protein
MTVIIIKGICADGVTKVDRVTRCIQIPVETLRELGMSAPSSGSVVKNLDEMGTDGHFIRESSA